MITENKIDFSGPDKTTGLKIKKPDKKTTHILPTESENHLYARNIELEAQNRKLISQQSKLLTDIKEYTQLFNYAPASYFILDKDGYIINTNHTALNQIGTTKKHLIGNCFSSFFNSKTALNDFNKLRDSVIKTGITGHFECEIKCSNGELFYALIEISMVRDKENNFKQLFTIVSDISDHKAKEKKIAKALIKEMELNEMKSQFITIASHEFRTPLATILSSSELIEKYDKVGDENKRAGHFRKIRTSVQRMEEILIDFMVANEVEDDELTDNPENFNITEFTKNLLEEIKSFNGIHQVTYEHLGSYQNVFLDKKLLKASLTNLLINAYKYSPDGGLIEIITEQSIPNIISFTIRDNGIGIPENDQANIFKQFFRAKNSENYQGTGLGLNITRRLISIMRGNISFQSKENCGSTFLIEFDLR